jgi:transcriptional regulator with XRE-family HTH domain
VEGTDFSVWLELQLGARGWRPADLATAAGLPNATITRILNGERRAGPDVATAIAQAFDLSPEFVFRRAGLLPESPGPERDLSFQEMSEIMRNMTADERRDVIEYALFRLRRRGK